MKPFARPSARPRSSPDLAPSRQSSVVKTDNVRAELVSEVSEVKPGEPFWVGLRQTIRPKWHTYWKNPGDSGLPTEINWTLPAGAKADPIVWPAPTCFDIGGVINYGFQDDVLLLVQITPPADLARARSTLARRRQLAGVRGRLHPRGRQVRAHPAGRRRRAKPADADTRALFDKARRIVPMESPWPARFGLAKSGDPTLIVEAKGLKRRHDPRRLFLPGRMGPGRQHGQADGQRDADGIRIPLKKGDAKAAAPQQIAGTLVLTEKTGDGEQRQAFDVVGQARSRLRADARRSPRRAAASSSRWSRRCCSPCWAA